MKTIKLSISMRRRSVPKGDLERRHLAQDIGLELMKRGHINFSSYTDKESDSDLGGMIRATIKLPRKI